MSNHFAPILERRQLIEEFEKVRANGAVSCLRMAASIFFTQAMFVIWRARKSSAIFLSSGSIRTSRSACLKGEKRPYIDEDERAEIVSALRFVDFVTIFPEPTVEELILGDPSRFSCEGH